MSFNLFELTAILYGLNKCTNSFLPSLVIAKWWNIVKFGKNVHFLLFGGKSISYNMATSKNPILSGTYLGSTNGLLRKLYTLITAVSL